MLLTIFCWSSLQGQQSGMFSDPKDVYKNELCETEYVYAFDVENDGDQDALVLSYDQIAWFENDGNGNFSSKNSVMKNIKEGRDICTADLNGNGYEDIIYASNKDETIAWFENDGSGNFSNQNVLTSTAKFAKTVEAADLDGDGDQDIVYGSTSYGVIAWFENDGSGNFASQQIISDSANAYSIKITDINEDGFPDIVSTANWDRIVWFENDGNGNFANKQVIDILDYSPKHIYTADLNNDGHVDLLSSGHQYVHQINWYQNDGNGNFSGQKYIDSTRAAKMTVADMNNDSLPDVITGRYWYENTGAGTFSNKKILSNIPSGFSFPADLNNDGHMDALHGNGHGLGWIQNQGNSNFDQYKVIQNSIKGLRSLHYDDLNNDGYQDIISGSLIDNKVAWHENKGNGNFTMHVVAVKESDGVYSVNTCDMNGNNHPDIIVSSINDGKVIWYPNDGSGNFGNYHVIDSTARGARQVLISDMNDDSLPDVIVVAEWSEHVFLYENNGNGNFSPPIEITDSIYNLETAAIADINADGHKDVVAAAWDSIMWYRNDGSGNYISEGTIINGYSASYKIEDELIARDINGDNYPDIVTPNVNGTGYYENNGNGTFTFQDLGYNYKNSPIVAVEDIDNDGDYDIITDWYCYINDGNGNFPEVYPISADNYISELSLNIVDLNNDSLPDIVRGYDNFPTSKILWLENQISTSIKSIEDKSGINTYPNPTKGKLHITSKDEKINQIEIYTITGRLISKTGEINSREYVHDMTGLPKGAYIIQIHLDHTIQETKIIKE